MFDMMVMNLDLEYAKNNTKWSQKSADPLNIGSSFTQRRKENEQFPNFKHYNLSIHAVKVHEILGVFLLISLNGDPKVEDINKSFSLLIYSLC